MAIENRVLLELLQSHSNLGSTNPVLQLGQRVFVTGITDALGNGEKIGDGSTTYNLLKWQRYELLKSIDLTSANSTYTLPKIDGGYQRVSLYWTNGGTYKMTLAVTNAETVGGIAAGTWLGEGDGHMVVESDGTNWQVREYEDSGGVYSTGTWQKSLNGIIDVQQPISGGGAGVNTNTIIKPLINANYRVTANNNTSIAASDITVKFSNKTTTTVDVVITVNAAFSGTSADMHLSGRWRT